MSHVGCPTSPLRHLQRAVAFYTTVLDFTLKGKEDSSIIARSAGAGDAKATKTRAQTASSCLGEECLDLTEYSSPQGRAFRKIRRATTVVPTHCYRRLGYGSRHMRGCATDRVRFVSNVPQTLPEWNKDARGIRRFTFVIRTATTLN